MIKTRLVIIIGRIRAAGRVEFGGDGIDNALHLCNHQLSETSPYIKAQKLHTGQLLLKILDTST